MRHVGSQFGPELVPAGRRGAILRPSPTSPGVFGVDLTSGCAHGCVYCPVRGTGHSEAEGRLPFDPFTAEGLRSALDEQRDRVRTLVLSPLSDPLPSHRLVREEAVRVAEVALEREIDLFVMTRGRFPRRLVELLADHRQRARVAIGLFSLNKALVRRLEPLAASPRGRLRDIARLSAAGVSVEVRLEPLIPGLTDTREVLVPLFRELAAAGGTRVVAHYLFLHPAMKESLQEALQDLEWQEKTQEAFENGPRLVVGSLGTVRNLPREYRREGLARIMAWGAEFGLNVSTGAAQNPDLPRIEPVRRIEPAAKPGAGRMAALAEAVS